MAKRHPQIACRPLVEADYAELPRLIGSAEEAAEAFWEAEDPADPGSVRALLQARQDLAVVESGGRVVGLGALSEVEVGRHGYLGPVVVDPEFRGHGAGSLLVAHLLEIAFRRHGLREVRTRVLGGNEDGLVLFSELGFIPYSTEEATGPGGRPRVVVQMRLVRGAHQDND
jgi:predicted N-acetyltransferase YhbS